MSKKPPLTEVEKAVIMAPRLASELTAATDALIQVLKTFEKQLLDLHLGVAAEVLLDEEPSGRWRKLRFGKHGNTWGLYVAQGDKKQPNRDPLVQHLLNASRQVRLAAIDHLEELVILLVQNAQAERLRVQDSLAKVQVMLGEIEKLKPEAES